MGGGNSTTNITETVKKNVVNISNSFLSQNTKEVRNTFTVVQGILLQFEGDIIFDNCNVDFSQSIDATIDNKSKMSDDISVEFQNSIVNNFQKLVKETVEQTNGILGIGKTNESTSIDKTYVEEIAKFSNAIAISSKQLLDLSTNIRQSVNLVGGGSLICRNSTFNINQEINYQSTMESAMETKIVAAILNDLQSAFDLAIDRTTTQKNKGLELFDFGALLGGLAAVPAGLGIAKALLSLAAKNKAQKINVVTSSK